MQNLRKVRRYDLAELGGDGKRGPGAAVLAAVGSRRSRTRSRTRPARASRCGRSAAGTRSPPAAATSGAALDLSGWTGVVAADVGRPGWSRCGRAPRSGSSTARSTRSAWPCPTWATSTRRRSPARSRPGRTAPAPGSAASPPRSPRSSWCWPTGRSSPARPQQRPDLFAAARVASARSACISTVTLQCVPAFDAGRRRAADAAWARCSSGSASSRRSNDHFEFYWFPYGKNALVKRNNRVDRTGRRRCRPGGGSSSTR